MANSMMRIRGRVREVLLGVILLTGVEMMLKWGAAYGEEKEEIAPPTVETQRAYEQLAKALEDEVRLLSGIRDAATCQQAIEPLKKLLEGMKAQRKGIDEEVLWRYIDNTPNLKQPLINTLEFLFLQLQRLHQKKYFGSAELQRLLRVQLKPASGKPAR